ncbi:MAG: hypothetical protein F6K59_36365 [Moorea sp. SIO3F7]|nr:hypothetical protein [Moorena sp. SIO3E8]NEQ04103.1 hypothetical protein [Moorena sp. SIO3F7]
MDKLEGLPKRSLIKKWLKCGYVDNRIFHPTNSGTPQGGIISPLLANIALDGLQEVISEKCKIDYTTRSRGKTINKKKEVDKYRFARYADDFVITSQTKENLEEIIPRVEKWLRKRGLELNREKTKIRNIIEEGFSFLGFQIQQRKTKTLRLDSKRYKKKARKMLKNLKPNAIRIPTPNAKIREEICYSCIITPDQEEVKRFLKEIRSILKNEARALNTEDVIKKLNPKIRGWLNYYRFVCSKKTFNNVRYKILSSIYRYLKRQHPKKAWKWIKRKYFKTIDKDTLNFFTISSGKRKKEEILVNAAKDVPIIRFEKVKGNSSPFDPDLKEYWKKRKTKWGKSKFAKGSKYEKVYIHQKGICPICNLPIELDDNFEVHHTIPIKGGGNSETKNLQILHSHCHKAKHKKLHQDT